MKKISSTIAKEEILNAALSLFMQKGYVNTSMDDIAEAVGLTKGGVYYYVEKKEDLLTGIHDQMLDELIKRVKSAVEGESDPIKKLSNWIRKYTSLIEDYQAHIKIFFTEINHYPKDSFEQLEQRRAMVPVLLQDILLSGIAEKKFRSDVDPFVASYLILGMINWMYIWYRQKGKLSLDQIIENIEKLIFNGIVFSLSGEESDKTMDKLMELQIPER